MGAYSAWFVRALMFVCGIVAFPISKLLDWVLGEEHDVSCFNPHHEPQLYKCMATRQLLSLNWTCLNWTTIACSAT